MCDRFPRINREDVLRNTESLLTSIEHEQDVADRKDEINANNVNTLTSRLPNDIERNEVNDNGQTGVYICRNLVGSPQIAGKHKRFGFKDILYRKDKSKLS
jgi:hypothetical protein